MLRVPCSISFCFITNGARPAVTRAAIQCIHNQRFPLGPGGEIIICGNIQPLGNLEPVNTLLCPDLSAAGLLGDLRNQAGQFSSGDTIVFLDDDVFLPPTFTSRLLEYSGSHSWQALGVKLLEADGTVLQDPQLRPTDPRRVLTGAFACLRRETFAAHRWDPNIPFYAQGLHEDEEFSRRLHAAGIPIHQDSGNRAYHWNKRHGPGDFCPELCRMLAALPLQPA